MADHDTFCRCSDPAIFLDPAFCACDEIALVRADERGRNKAEYVPVLMEHLRMWADLRAQVEALPIFPIPVQTDMGPEPLIFRRDALSLFDRAARRS